MLSHGVDGSVQLEKYSQSAHCIAWVLRTFLAELPEPLLTRKFGSSFIKTQSNPDLAARYRNMRKLINALPVVNRAVIRSVLELFRLVLHHRRKNKLTVSDFCSDLGPILLGVDKIQNAPDAALAADVLKTLITQFQFMIGTADEPAEYDSLPLYTKKSQRVLLTSNSRARGLIAKKRTHSPNNSNISAASSLPSSLNNSNTSVPSTANGSNTTALTDSSGILVPPSSTSPPPQPHDEEELVSLTDGIMLKFLDQSVRSVLFEPQVRISFNYEAKIPNHMKRNYTLDKLTEIHRGSTTAESRLGAWRPTLEEDGPNSTFGGGGGGGGSSAHKRRDTIMSNSVHDGIGEDGASSAYTRHRRNTASGREDSAGGKSSGRMSALLPPPTADSDQSQHDGGGDRDGDSSGSASSAKRRSRRISIQDDLSGEYETRALVRTTSEEFSVSDEISHARRHISADHLEEILEFYTDSSGSDGDVAAGGNASASGNGTAAVGDGSGNPTSSRRKKKHMERRASTSKVTTGARAKLHQASRDKEKRRRPTHSGEISPEEIEKEAASAATTAPFTSSQSPFQTAPSSSSSSSAAAAAAAQTSPHAIPSIPSYGAPSSSKEAGATATAASGTPTERLKVKAPRPKSKPPHVLLDSKTIMENAPSPPSEMPPPLAIPHMDAPAD
jgi:hypothetical protein